MTDYTAHIAAALADIADQADPGSAPWLDYESRLLALAWNSGVAGTVSIAHFGAVGDGVTDDTAAFRDAGRSGKIVQLQEGKTYIIGSAIDVVTTPGKTVGFVGPRTAAVYMDPVAFNNTDATVLFRYGENAYGFRVDNGAVAANTTSRVLFKGFELIGGAGDATTDGRVVGGIWLRNVGRFDVVDMDIWGFPVGKGVCAMSCYGGGVFHSKIHDFYENTLYGPRSSQLTGIEIDNDIIAGNTIGSRGLRFIDNDIYNITVGAEFVASDGDQTDGINLLSKAEDDPESGGHFISRNRMWNIAEGLDCFADRCVVTNNTFTDIYSEALKFPHGASFNTVDGNIVNGSGLCGIGLGSSDVNGDVEGNVFTNNVILNINPDGDWDDSSFNSCIFLIKAGTGDVKNNTFAHNVLRPGDGNYAIARVSGATGTNNNFYYNDATTGAVAILSATSETGTVVQAGSLPFPAVFVTNADPYALDDYREVAWTPAIGATGTAPSGVTYVVAAAFYTKIGRYFHAWGRVVTSSKGTGGTGNATITGFPLTAVGSQPMGPTRATGYTPVADAQLCGLLTNSTMVLEEWGNALHSELTWANLSNTVDILFEFSGMTAT